MTVITNTSGKNELLQVSESKAEGRGFLEGQMFPERIGIRKDLMQVLRQRILKR